MNGQGGKAAKTQTHPPSQARSREPPASRLAQYNELAIATNMLKRGADYGIMGLTPAVHDAERELVTP